MRSLLIVVVSAVIFTVIIGITRAENPSTTMYTLNEIYYYLAEGTEASWGEHSLEPQSGTAGQTVPGFTKSLADVYYFMADSFSQCNLTPASAPEGYYFFCTDSNYWGVQKGEKTE